MPPRVPAVAVAALRGHVERFLRAHGVASDMTREDADVDVVELVGMLLAGLRHVRLAHPWLGRGGAIVEAPEPEPPGLLPAVARALPDPGAPLTAEACVAALQRAWPFVVDDAPCGRRGAPPGVYPYMSFETDDALPRDDLADRVFGVVTDEDWLAEPGRRDAVLAAVVPANAEPLGFEALGDDRARALACHLRDRRACERESAEVLRDPGRTVGEKIDRRVERVLRRGIPLQQNTGQQSRLAGLPATLDLIAEA